MRAAQGGRTRSKRAARRWPMSRACWTSSSTRAPILEEAMRLYPPAPFLSREAVGRRPTRRRAWLRRAPHRASRRGCCTGTAKLWGGPDVCPGPERFRAGDGAGSIRVCLSAVRRGPAGLRRRRPSRMQEALLALTHDRAALSASLIEGATGDAVRPHDAAGPLNGAADAASACEALKDYFFRKAIQPHDFGAAGRLVGLVVAAAAGSSVRARPTRGRLCGLRRGRGRGRLHRSTASEVSCATAAARGLGRRLTSASVILALRLELQAELHRRIEEAAAARRAAHAASR